MASMSSAVKKSGMPAKRLAKRGVIKVKVKGQSDSLSRLEGDLVVLLPVVGVDLGKVKGLGKEVVNEGAKGHAVGPGRGKVFDPDSLKVTDHEDQVNWHSTEEEEPDLVVTHSALAPDENGLHLW